MDAVVGSHCHTQRVAHINFNLPRPVPELDPGTKTLLALLNNLYKRQKSTLSTPLYEKYLQYCEKPSTTAATLDLLA